MFQSSSQVARPWLFASLLLLAACGRTDFPPSHGNNGKVTTATGGITGSGGSPTSTGGGQTIPLSTGGALPLGHPWPVFGRDPQGTRRSPVDTSKNKGRLKWSVNLGNAPLSSPVVAEDGTVFVFSTAPTLYAVAAPASGSTGNIVWSFSPPMPTTRLSSTDTFAPAIAGDRVVYISVGDALYAINAPTAHQEGSLKWTYQVPSQYDVVGPITVGDDGTTYVLGSRLFAFDGMKGNLKWSAPSAVTGIDPPVVGKDGTIYFGLNDLIAVAPPRSGQDGILKWTFKEARPGSTPAIGADGTLYVGGNDLRVTAISPGTTNSSPSLKWSYRTGSMVHEAPAIGPDGTVYVPGIAWDLFAFAPNPASTDGQLMWRWAPPAGFALGASPAVGGDGTVYVAGKGGVYALTPPAQGEAPTVKWSFPTPGTLVSSPSIGADGTVYATDDGGMLYALQ